MLKELYGGFLPNVCIHLVNFLLLSDNNFAGQGQNKLSLIVIRYVIFFQSSLKLYQDTHQEYARVKEECLKTDAQ